MLNLEAYNGHLGMLIEQAKRFDVDYILCIGVDLKNAHYIIDIAQQFKNVFASVGVHPSEKLEITEEPSVQDLIELADHPKVIAIGETGLDYYYNDSGLDIMRERFRRHIRAAIKIKKPLVIHTRKAQIDTITILQEENAEKIRGVMHCFTENLEMAKKAMALNFYISFSGIITFKNAKEVNQVAKIIPLEKILIETDAPYLTPHPYRGKPNEPQYVRFIAEHLARLKNIPLQKVARQTTNNFFSLFDIDPVQK